MAFCPMANPGPCVSCIAGVLMSRSELERASELCRAAGSWLVMDDTYEHFVYGDREHVCLPGEHIIHIFSFSKAFGMMGWRMGCV